MGGIYSGNGRIVGVNEVFKLGMSNVVDVGSAITIFKLKTS